MKTPSLIQRIGTLLLALALGSSAFAQPINPANPPIQCEYDPEGGGHQTLDEITGTAKILWVVCAADSHALPSEWPVHTAGDDCGQTRIMYPSTYAMPSWATMMFDSNNERSLTRYFKDQSRGRFRAIGEVERISCGGLDKMRFVV